MDPFFFYFIKITPPPPPQKKNIYLYLKLYPLIIVIAHLYILGIGRLQLYESVGPETFEIQLETEFKKLKRQTILV